MPQLMFIFSRLAIRCGGDDGFCSKQLEQCSRSLRLFLNEFSFFEYTLRSADTSVAAIGI
jgi:hypothetical protein